MVHCPLISFWHTKQPGGSEALALLVGLRLGAGTLDSKAVSSESPRLVDRRLLAAIHTLWSLHQYGLGMLD